MTDENVAKTQLDRGLNSSTLCGASESDSSLFRVAKESASALSTISSIRIRGPLKAARIEKLLLFQ